MIKKILSKKNRLIPLLLALLIIGSVSVIGVMGKSNSSHTADRKVNTEHAFDDAVNLPISADSYSRCQWLYDLLNTTGKAEFSNSSDAQTIFRTAKSLGIISRYRDEEFFAPLTRLYVAETAVRALGYKRRDIGGITDITMMQKDLATMAYYGYFLPDINDMIHPEQEITQKEYDNLLAELKRYRLLSGKHILTFGDSIMHGSGNENRGIGQILAEKYNMEYADYSVPGASVGIRENRGHIRDQLKKALDDHVSPDIILLNGGTNDMYHTQLGKMTSGYDVADIKEDDFSGGLEKTLWSLQTNWKNVPVIYIRAHNMDFGSDDKEQLFGEQALSIAHKWKIPYVDLYRQSGMNTEDVMTCNRYTYVDSQNDYTYDSIHPNALGYATYYLPPIEQEIINQIYEETP